MTRFYLFVVLVFKMTNFASSFFQISEKEISVHAGLNLRIPCKVDHDPLNRLTNIMWSLNDEPIEGIFEIGSDKSLNIASVRKQHSGTYR